MLFSYTSRARTGRFREDPGEVLHVNDWSLCAHTFPVAENIDLEKIVRWGVWYLIARVKRCSRKQVKCLYTASGVNVHAAVATPSFTKKAGVYCHYILI